MAFCRRCGIEYLDQAVVCPSCGFPQYPTAVYYPSVRRYNYAAIAATCLYALIIIMQFFPFIIFDEKLGIKDYSNAFWDGGEPIPLIVLTAIAIFLIVLGVLTRIKALSGVSCLLPIIGIIVYTYKIKDVIDNNNEVHRALSYYSNSGISNEMGFAAGYYVEIMLLLIATVLVVVSLFDRSYTRNNQVAYTQSYGAAKVMQNTPGAPHITNVNINESSEANSHIENK